MNVSAGSQQLSLRQPAKSKAEHKLLLDAQIGQQHGANEVLNISTFFDVARRRSDAILATNLKFVPRAALFTVPALADH